MRTLPLFICFFLTCVLTGKSQEYLISGCGYDKVAVINRDGDILWSYKVPGADCNDAEVTNNGNVLLAYKYGAMLVDSTKNILWDIKVNYPDEEMYTATQMEDGHFLLACCGNPSRIMEVDTDGKVLKELKYDTGLKEVHGQFRQIVKTEGGTYIIPIMSKGVIREMTDCGNLVREIEVGGTPFQVSVLNNGNWLVAGGDGSMIVEVSPRDGKKVRIIDNDNFKECRLKFVAECTALDNGNILVANWDGHHMNEEKSPAIIEISPDNKLVWSLGTDSKIYRISTLSLINDMGQ